ncbi:putative Chitinase 6 [Hypsibius exemplaris]|uniref:Chitinase 6 n=1 Tax=Hypsibius exemplaris TaxID=2072580 RepID=A0A1W0WIR8_HYPEX|nr:putative Chitinase 6 [Hypsibius exemplaris]
MTWKSVFLMIVVAIVSQLVRGCRLREEGCSTTITCCGDLACDKGPGAAWGFCRPSGSSAIAAPSKSDSSSGSQSSSIPIFVSSSLPDALCSKEEFITAVTSAGGFGVTPSDEQYRNFVARAVNGQITTKRELAMFLANVIHESAGLTTKEEWGPPAPGTYPNTVGVPGKNYHGRGYIQLTWDYNYKNASMALYGDLRLLNDPDQVKSNDMISWDTAFWYWSAHVHGAAGVQEGNFGTTIMKINGGIECGSSASNPTGARKRLQMYQDVLKAFGLFVSEAQCSNACDCVILTFAAGSQSGGKANGNPALKPAPIANGCSQTYTIKSGESFWLIGKNNGMMVDQLLTLNPSVEKFILRFERFGARIRWEGARATIYDPEVLEHVIVRTLDEPLTPRTLLYILFAVTARDRVIVCHNAYKAAARSHVIVICIEWDLFKCRVWVVKPTYRNLVCCQKFVFELSEE